MSYVERLLDGTYEVGILYQDGYSRHTCKTKEEAIKSYKSGVALNGGYRDNTDEIPDPVIIYHRKWPQFSVDTNGDYAISDDELRRALRVAMRLSGRDIQPGRRYRLIVSFREVEGDLPFLGEGI